MVRWRVKMNKCVCEKERERARARVCGGRGEPRQKGAVWGRSDRLDSEKTGWCLDRETQRTTDKNARDGYTHTHALTTVTTWGRLSVHWAYRRDSDDHREVRRELTLSVCLSVSHAHRQVDRELHIYQTQTACASLNNMPECVCLYVHPWIACMHVCVCVFVCMCILELHACAVCVCVFSVIRWLTHILSGLCNKCRLIDASDSAL